MKNLFIVFDGMDGCGKSTHVSNLQTYLFQKDKRVRVLTTREPTFGKYGTQIREMLTKHPDPYSDAELLLRLYVNDRKDHVNKLIKPFLRKDYNNISIVLCDRYYYSTIAYQHTQGLELSKLIKLSEGFPKPDLTIIFDIHPETALKRIERERGLEKFEKVDFMNELRQNFLALKDLLKDNIVYVDTSGVAEETFEKVKRAVDKLLKG
jgi:dTMP kinase